MHCDGSKLRPRKTSRVRKQDSSVNSERRIMQQAEPISVCGSHLTTHQTNTMTILPTTKQQQQQNSEQKQKYVQFYAQPTQTDLSEISLILKVLKNNRGRVTDLMRAKKSSSTPVCMINRSG